MMVNPSRSRHRVPEDFWVQNLIISVLVSVDLGDNKGALRKCIQSRSPRATRHLLAQYQALKSPRRPASQHKVNNSRQRAKLIERVIRREADSIVKVFVIIIATVAAAAVWWPRPVTFDQRFGSMPPAMSRDMLQ